ncbi:hypothetical protein A9264_14215 [Vibrio sp. UCD-FRSSP16_10]|uniref:hypothetical protein n=1 Tax=unclassified Vibrio TaxID=2614977 RepID=UPI000801D843|nr:MULTISPECIES: hypothetical protein [unclassified Vibrio]OBT13262.1 hypothetical protein A9260_14595 [Vibrio sp. UCD-FRSSP16_30]OBT19612.1 hypothetical protein A9264_14215 [Vibrio sp. UCD-FRSSP16_10]
MDTSKLAMLKNSIKNDIANDELSGINTRSLLRGEASIIESYLSQKARKIARVTGTNGTDEATLSSYQSFFSQFTDQIEAIQPIPAIYLERMSSIVGYQTAKNWSSL